MPTLTQIAYAGLRDIGELRPGQGTSTDANNDILVKANQMLDSFALEQMLVYQSSNAVLTAFADLSTNYTFAPGWLDFVQTNLAVWIAPMMRIYAKLPDAEWDKNVAAVTARAAAITQKQRGVGPAGVV